MSDVRDEIARLEERVEALAVSIERCRKVSLAAKIAILVGGAWLALTLLALVTFTPSLFFGAIAAAIGGVVLLGSNATTWNETAAALKQAEAARMTLIGSIDLTVVDDGVKRLH
ncbi:MAG TPA: hypothetical protein VGV41_00985 [Pseudolabrys sp.]|jgi:hypothetical protein|uniref:hypothetical protein n=1 Tax=Pseudolabrys sp. TaxID=1960880 RepID=UPI002DDD7A6D|nr:hypothetical protein [Pseudolabrys sp.]HEV2627206.1 hypothetical protein [Pseudolabrys sp.]